MMSKIGPVTIWSVMLPASVVLYQSQSGVEFYFATLDFPCIDTKLSLYNKKTLKVD